MSNAANAAVLSGLDRIREVPVDGDVRVARRLEIGSAVQQGDLYLLYVPTDHPHGDKVIGSGVVQVALGTNTGARHMVEGDVTVYEGSKLPDYVKVLEGIDPKEVMGYFIEARKNFMLTHPEHPHHSLPAGCYQVIHQIDMVTQRRVVD